MDISSILEDIYYNTKTGISSSDKLYRRVKQSHPDITRKQVNDFINSQETNQVFKRKIVNYYPLSSYSPLQRVQIDLLDVSNDSSQNKNTKFLFNCVDVYTKYAFSIPLKNKSDTEVFQAWKTIVEQIIQMNAFPPSQVDHDLESSFLSRKFQKYCKDNNITQHTSQFDNYKAEAVVERFNRSLRNMIEKYKTAFHTRTYIDVLPDLINNYNTSYHQNIQTTPEEAIKNNSKYEKKMLLQINRARVKDTDKVFVGTKVRVKIKKALFDKKTSAIWSKTIHKVEKIDKGVYYVSDRVNGYKKYELLPIDKVDQYKEKNNDEIVDDENEVEEEKKERKITRNIRKEGISKDDIEQDPTPKQLRKYRKPRDMGFNILY